MLKIAFATAALCLAFAASTSTAVYAQKKSCSDRKATCDSQCPARLAKRKGEGAQAYCAAACGDKFASCMRTGSWPGRMTHHSIQLDYRSLPR
jgi:hypothetical protein